jgi:hypothetical protein
VTDSRRSVARREDIRGRIRSTPAPSSSRVVPYPAATDRDYARLTGQDLQDLSNAAIWAERAVLRAALAARLCQHERDPLIVADSANPIRESTWITRRIHALDAEARRRPNRGLR